MFVSQTLDTTAYDFQLIYYSRVSFYSISDILHYLYINLICISDRYMAVLRTTNCYGFVRFGFSKFLFYLSFNCNSLLLLDNIIQIAILSILRIKIPVTSTTN
jgi:hypothetical protein